MDSQLQSLTKEQFEQEVLKSTQPVLIDFYADWCGPCKTMAPIIEELAREYAGRAKVLEVNVDEQTELASQHGVMSIPTFVVYGGGKEQARLVGSQPKDKLIEALEGLLQ